MKCWLQTRVTARCLGRACWAGLPQGPRPSLSAGAWSSRVCRVSEMPAHNPAQTGRRVWAHPLRAGGAVSTRAVASGFCLKELAGGWGVLEGSCRKSARSRGQLHRVKDKAGGMPQDPRTSSPPHQLG